MLIALPDGAVTQIRGPREGWTVHEGFDPGAGDANAGAKDSESLWLVHKMGGNEAAGRDGRGMVFAGLISVS